MIHGIIRWEWSWLNGREGELRKYSAVFEVRQEIGVSQSLFKFGVQINVDSFLASLDNIVNCCLSSVIA